LRNAKDPGTERGLGAYLTLYLCYMRANWLALMAYPAQFWGNNLGNLIRNVIGIAAVGIVFGHVRAIGGWAFEQVLFLYALTMVARALWHLFMVNCLSLPVYVQRGLLDRLLVRPANVLFQLYAEYLDNDDWGELVLGLVVLGMAAGRLGLWGGGGAWNFLWLAVTIASATAIYGALHLAAAATAFWLVRAGAVSQIIWQIDEFSRYPLSIYGRPLRFLLTWIVPFGFVGFYPAHLFFGPAAAGMGAAPTGGPLFWMARLTPVVAAVLFATAYRIWRTGLDRYQGTGS
jgi:ABC-2 type transport system permease protein